MVERLERIARTARPLENHYFNDINADFLAQALPQTTDPDLLLSYQLRFPLELLRAGRSAAAIEAFRELEGWLAREHPQLARDNRLVLLSHLATSYLRLGEQDNCLERHNIDSCLFPIQGSGVHQVQRGSAGAVSVLQEWLEADPGDLAARWLLNLAHMTLGTYPDEVPRPWRIEKEVFASEARMPRFHDMAGPLGLDLVELSGGSVLEDFDKDGYLDLMVSSIGRQDSLHYFHNQADGTFADRTAAAGLAGLTGGLNLLQADYDNDGFLDVLVLRGGWFGRAGRHPNSLLRNRGDGTFEDVTDRANLLSLHPTQTAVWFDYNLDGWIDLFIGNESTPNSRHACELFRNNGDGTFTEVAGQAGVQAHGYVKGVVSADVDNDRRPDLFLSLFGGENLLFRNQGPVATGKAAPTWRFREDTPQAMRQPGSSFSAIFFDYDNDGWEDLFVAGYNSEDLGLVAADYLDARPRAEPARLFRNLQGQGYEDVSHEVRMDRVLLAMGCNYGDLDSDGWLDLYLGTGSPSLSMLVPNVALRNQAGRRFQDVTAAAGLGHLQKGHGISFGDVDHDGDQDIHINMGGAYTGDVYPNALFENPGHDHHWLGLHLEGVMSNRAAIGARIRVSVRDGEGASRILHRTVRSGGSFGASPLRQEIGLGKAGIIERVEVDWPASGISQVLTGLEPDRFYKIREDQSDAQAWPLASFGLVGNRSGRPHHHP